MKDNIDLCGVPVKPYNAREAMERAQKLLETEPVSMVKMLTFQTLSKCGDVDGLTDILRSFDLLLIGDTEVFEAAGIDSALVAKEIKERSFARQFLKYLARLKKCVFLITDTDEDLALSSRYLGENYKDLKISASISMEGADRSAERVANAINGSEAEVILSLVSSPEEEEFFAENKNTINSRLWLGLGKDSIGDGTDTERRKSWLRRRFEKRVLYRMSKK